MYIYIKHIQTFLQMNRKLSISTTFNVLKKWVKLKIP